jgi:hypothetical protein
VAILWVIFVFGVIFTSLVDKFSTNISSHEIGSTPVGMSCLIVFKTAA